MVYLPLSVQAVLCDSTPKLSGQALEEFSRRARDAHHATGKSAREMADTLGISRSTVNWALRGILATQDTVEKMSAYLGIEFIDGPDRVRFVDAKGQQWVLAKLENEKGEMV